MSLLKEEQYLSNYLKEMEEYGEIPKNIKRTDYLPCEVITCFDDFYKYTTDKSLLDILDTVSKAELEKEFYDRFKSEYISCGYSLTDFYGDLPYFEIDSL